MVPNSELLQSAIENSRRSSEDWGLLINDNRLDSMSLGREDQLTFTINGAANLARVDCHKDLNE